MATRESLLLERALNLPALAAPPGFTTNLINPSNLETEFYIDLVLCLIISSLAVCMRMWTKACLIQKFGREDCKEFFTRPYQFFFVNLGLMSSQGSASLPSYELSVLIVDLK